MKQLPDDRARRVVGALAQHVLNLRKANMRITRLVLSMEHYDLLRVYLGQPIGRFYFMGYPVVARSRWDGQKFTFAKTGSW